MGSGQRVTRRLTEAEIHLLRPHVERYVAAQRSLADAVRILAPREMTAPGATFDPVRYEIRAVAVPARLAQAEANGGP